MALRAQSLFLYDFQITDNNKYVTFVGTSGGPDLVAQLSIGFYSLSGLMTELKGALEAADPTHTYTVTADRTVNDGTENRVTISTSGAYLDLLFGTGNPSNPATLLGFTATDQTGATTYTGTSTAGVALIPALYGYTYLGPGYDQKVFGSVNVSASGVKEAVVFQIQEFISVTYKYQPQDQVDSDWIPFMRWAIQQRPFEFTPEIDSPGVFYDVTMERTEADGQALAYKMTEMLPEFPFFYSTGALRMRKRVT